MNGAEYAAVLELQGCKDTQDSGPDGSSTPLDSTLDDGDSNYLPAGTRLYVTPGHDSTA